MQPATSALAVSLFFRDLLRAILLFPVWWYSRGVVQVLRWFRRSLTIGLLYTGVSVWAKNIFVPMYGETQLSGRLISFVMRVVMIAVRGGVYLLWVLVSLAAVVLYLLILPLSVIGIFFHAGGLLFA